jgi:hypothetical protein
MESWQTLHCEAIRYSHTIIRPAYCPFCLWDINQPAEERLQHWSRNGHLKERIESQYLLKCSGQRQSLFVDAPKYFRMNAKFDTTCTILKGLRMQFGEIPLKAIAKMKTRLQ